MTSPRSIWVFGFDLMEKQKFLEMTSTYERLRKSTESLGKILERIKLNSAISKIINGNGNLSKYGHVPVD